MLTNKVAQFVVEFSIVYLLILVFFYLGGLILKPSKRAAEFFTSVYSRLFFQIIAGLFVTISFYAIIVTGGITINMLILPLLYFIFLHPGRTIIVDAPKTSPAIGFKHHLEIGVIAFLSLIILHVFPVNEYKQADGFFYLKIAESMNATGQENISHYFNLYNKDFNGAEPYHYFEIWITAFVIRFTESFLPSILVERFVTQSLLLTAIVLGLYMVAKTVLKRAPRFFDKFFCWSLLFIFPNVLGYFPKLYAVFISDFEGNMLDRPNFRIIYLLLIPIINDLFTRGAFSKNVLYLLLLLSVTSFQFAVVLIPGLLLYSIFLIFKKDSRERMDWLPIIAFCIAFAGFYWVFSVKNIPSFFKADTTQFLVQTFKGYKFILFSIVTSTLYILLLVFALLLPLFLKNRRQMLDSCKHVLSTLFPLIFIAIAGILIARILYLKDNAYQFIFITHILITIFVWLVYLHQFKETDKSLHVIGGTCYVSFMWFLSWVWWPNKSVDIFRQNGAYVYEGKKYSATYLSEVNNFFDTSTQAVGGYLADSLFYESIYYSRRNPNVYFLPLTYVAANKHNRIIDFCLSDTTDIKFNLIEQIHKDYLDNAISRSLFFRFRSSHSALNYTQAVHDFIAANHLTYLVVTKEYPLDKLPVIIKQKITDPNTGERFLVL